MESIDATSPFLVCITNVLWLGKLSYIQTRIESDYHIGVGASQSEHSFNVLTHSQMEMLAKVRQIRPFVCWGTNDFLHWHANKNTVFQVYAVEGKTSIKFAIWVETIEFLSRQ